MTENDPTPTETPTPAPIPVPEPPPEPAEPFAVADLRAALIRPGHLLDVVLGERGRLVSTVRVGGTLAALIGVLMLCSVVGAMPFGTVDGLGRVMHAAVLFLGSVLICFPALAVFSSYLGVKLPLGQSLAIALVIPAAAALFLLGFFPIYWFLDVTMPRDGAVTGTTIRIVLLVATLLLALAHCHRCLFHDHTLRLLRASRALWIGWQVVLVFMTWRMALSLGLLE